MPVNINERMAALERYAHESSKKINLLVWKQMKMENAITISKKQKLDLEEQFRKLQVTNYELKETILKNESVIMDLTVKTRKMVDIEHLLKSVMEKTKESTEIKSEMKRLSQGANVIPAIQSEIERLSIKTEEVEEIKSEIKGLSQEAKLLPAIQSEIERLSTKTEEFTEMKLEMKRLSQEAKVFPAIKSKIERLSTKTEEVEDMKCEMSRLTEESKKVPAIITEIQGLATKTEVDDLKKQTNKLEVRNEKIKHSITSVKLSKPGNLTKDSYIKLDECYHVYVNNGMFDENSCSINPHCKGVYGIVLHTVQENDGKLDMRLRWDGDEGGHYVGRTGSHHDESTGMMCVSLDKGQNVWVVTRRVEGAADICSCRLICWLIH